MYIFVNCRSLFLLSASSWFACESGKCNNFLSALLLQAALCLIVASLRLSLFSLWAAAAAACECPDQSTTTRRIKQHDLLHAHAACCAGEKNMRQTSVCGRFVADGCRRRLRTSRLNDACHSCCVLSASLLLSS